MERRNFIKSSLGLGLGAALPGQVFGGTKTEESHKAVTPAKPTNNGKPHIILLMTDQQRSDALGCMGNKAVISPNIDQLAKEGTIFTSAYTAAPSSTPGRTGLLTGLSPWHHGMLGYGRVATNYRYELPRMLKELGYYTFGIGKMHWFPQKTLHGFHGTLVDESGRVDSPDFISDYRLWFQLNAPGKNPDETGISWNDHCAGAYKLDERLHPTSWTGQTACELIRNYDDERPLYLKVSFARPHSPYDPPQRFVDMYKDADIPKPSIGDWCGKYAERKDPNKEHEAAFGNFGDEYAQNSRKYYYANVTFVDEQIGQIIKTLKEKDMYDNALICFASDHGDMLGDHYHWRKTYPYEGSTHVPYIIKWPKNFSKSVPDGAKITQPVELRDFLPTFLDIAGGSIPEDLDGASLIKLVRGKEKEWRRYIDMEHSTCYSEDNYWAALTDGKIKYVWNFHNGSEQLFDLSKDPGETHELSRDASYKKQLLELRQAMVEHLSERGEGFVKDGKLVVRKTTMLYGPNYPKEK